MSDTLYSSEKLRQFEQVKLNEQQLDYELQRRDADNRNKISMIVFSGFHFIFGIQFFIVAE